MSENNLCSCIISVSAKLLWQPFFTTHTLSPHISIFHFAVLIMHMVTLAPFQFSLLYKSEPLLNEFVVPTDYRLIISMFVKPFIFFCVIFCDIFYISSILCSKWPIPLMESFIYKGNLL